MSKDDDLERNMGYVTEIINNGEFDFYELTNATMLRHSKLSPLRREDAEEAIIKAEEKRIIRLVGGIYRKC